MSNGPNDDGTSRASSKHLERLETMRRKRLAFDMRVNQSMSYRAIADAMTAQGDPVSEATIRIWIKEESVYALPQEDIEELRQHEAAKIDASENRILHSMAMLREQAERRLNEGALNINEELKLLRSFEETLNNIRKQRAQLLGTNRPIKVEHTHKVTTEFDEEVEALVALASGGGMVMSMPDDVYEEA